MKGVGPKIVDKIITTYGSYDRFLNKIQNYEIDELMNIAGLSQKKALDIIHYIHGTSNDYIKTPQAEDIYLDIIDRINEFSTTEYAKNRIKLLRPTNNYDEIQQMNNLIEDTLDEIKDLDLDYIHSLYKMIKPLDDEITPRFDDSFAIVCEEYDDYLNMLHKNYNKYTNIFPLEDQPNLDGYDYILYVYNEYNIEPPESPNIISIKNTADEYEILPDIILQYYTKNRKTLENVYKLRTYLNKKSNIKDVLDVLDIIDSFTQKDVPIEQIVDEVKQRADDKINEQIQQIALKGDEILQLLGSSDELPPKIVEIYKTILDDAQVELSEKTGILFDPFIIEYPIKIDEEEIERVKQNTIANKQIRQYEEKIRACQQLQQYKQAIQQETQDIIHYNFNFALACFFLYYNLTIPTIADEYILDEALHIRLQQELNDGNIMQKVTYNLSDDENIILLTGANSGGKTTLLEMLAQINIMTHMGIGVCAKNAVIPKTDEIYYFTKQQSLNAGAFETFLRSFIPAAVGDKKKLVLIDELESITELEAAIKIIIGFIELIQDKNNYAIIVTHMAPEILKQTQNINIRVDGIEAQGLDENYNLIVDRNPKINYLAKSTPELILKRIYQKSDEPEKSIYKEILDKF
nr:AAA family ATPase [Methanosphaera cuniculi]